MRGDFVDWYTRLPVRLRVLLLSLLVAPFPTWLAVLAVNDLSDGVTRMPAGRESTISGTPEMFALAALMCAAICAVALLFWLAVVNNWNKRWLPAWLKDRPFIGTAFLIILSWIAVLMGIEMLSGEITSSSRGAFSDRHVTVGETPIRFAMVCAMYLGWFAMLGMGWFVALKRWVNPEYRWLAAVLDRFKRPPID